MLLLVAVPAESRTGGSYRGGRLHRSAVPGVVRGPDGLTRTPGEWLTAHTVAALHPSLHRAAWEGHPVSRDHPPVPDPSVPAKETYIAPTVDTLGSLADLTRGGSVGPDDGFGGAGSTGGGSI